MDVRKLGPALSMGFSVVLGIAAAGSATAQPYAQPVTVVAEPAHLTKYVPYADLALDSAAGRRLLIHRIGQAIHELCPIFDEQGMIYNRDDCRDSAWRGAHDQMNDAVRLAKSGATLASAIEITSH